MRVHQMRRRFGLAPKALAHLGFAREMRMQHLDDERAAKLHMLGVIDMGHTARAQSMHDAIAIPGQAPERADLGIRRLRRASGDLGQRRRATRALNGDSAVPRAAVRAKQSAYPPNCNRTKSYGGQGPDTQTPSAASRRSSSATAASKSDQWARSIKKDACEPSDATGSSAVVPAGDATAGYSPVALGATPEIGVHVTACPASD